MRFFTYKSLRGNGRGLYQEIQLDPWNTRIWEITREMHCEPTRMYEKEIESVDLLHVADSERTRLRDERVLTHF